ncbi:MAG: alpha/beta hydrolase [Methanoregula sp.]|nr:MAG: alpha/beta hydrolase [Methanoregula sp.]
MIVLPHDEFLLVRTDSSFLIVAQANTRFALCIETESDEYCQTVEPDDLVVVSAPEGGDPEAGVMLIELVRSHHTPLIVLPRNHPGSSRLRYVVSVGPVITTSCNILRGTHPEQHLICASGELSGITLRGETKGVRISDLPPLAGIMRFRSQTSIEFIRD